MAQVRAKKDVYLGDHGHHKEDEVFDYTGAKNPNLEYLGRTAADIDDDRDVTYHQLTREELKNELGRRGLTFASNATDQKLRELLEADDKK